MRINSTMKKLLMLFVLVNILLSLSACVTVSTNGDGVLYYDDYEYNKAMIYLNGDSVTITGEKAAGYNRNENNYSMKYIPQELLAMTPEEARYIVYYQQSRELYGIYNSNGTGNYVSAYTRTLRVEIKDKTTGEIVESNIFYGGEPPSSISSDTSQDQYGSDPSEEEITNWIGEVLNSLS